MVLTHIFRELYIDKVFVLYYITLSNANGLKISLNYVSFVSLMVKSFHTNSTFTLRSAAAMFVLF
jgi:hypothetical protein